MKTLRESLFDKDMISKDELFRSFYTLVNMHVGKGSDEKNGHQVSEFIKTDIKSLKPKKSDLENLDKHTRKYYFDNSIFFNKDEQIIFNSIVTGILDTPLKSSIRMSGDVIDVDSRKLIDYLERLFQKFLIPQKHIRLGVMVYKSKEWFRKPQRDLDSITIYIYDERDRNSANHHDLMIMTFDFTTINK